MRNGKVKYYDNIRPYGWCGYCIDYGKKLKEARTLLTTAMMKEEAERTAEEAIISLKKNKSLCFITSIPCSELAYHMLERTRNLDKYELIRLHGEDVMVYMIDQRKPEEVE